MSENASITRLTFPRGGQYRVSAKLKDVAGHEIEGTSFFTVRGEGFDEGKDFRFDDLELITEKDEYAPGEEVEITINTNRPGSTVALFLRTQNGTYPEPIWLKLEGKSTTHRFRLAKADQPNLFIDAYTVSDAKVHQVTRQIIVPPKKRIATVELMPDAETYLPGQGSKVKVRVKDADGKPFTGQVVIIRKSRTRCVRWMHTFQRTGRCGWTFLGFSVLASLTLNEKSLPELALEILM
jgi:uncharacterized protein YfaS (alpha-2-macroglobulin family)